MRQTMTQLHQLFNPDIKLLVIHTNRGYFICTDVSLVGEYKLFPVNPS